MRGRDPFEVIAEFSARLAALERHLGVSRFIRTSACAWCGVEDCEMHCQYCLVTLFVDDIEDALEHSPACPFTTGLFTAEGEFPCGQCGQPVLAGERYGLLAISSDMTDEAGEVSSTSWSVPACLDCKAADVFTPPADA